MAAKAAPSKGANPPNQTLYVSNLPDKLQKQDLRRNLYFLFTAYGPVLDINASKTSKMRGQAFVVFRDTNAAAQAMRSLQGFEFFGKEMNIQYAKGKSDTIAKLDGTYKIPTAAGAMAAGPNTGERSELQQSIFAAPPGSASAKEAGKAVESAKKPDAAATGTKRPREEEEDEAMDEDDEGADMEMDESD